MDTHTLPEICVVYCTSPRDQSGAIARELLERRLVACVNITPVRSLYRWEGHICDDEEDLLIIKTKQSLVDDLIETITTIHPYDTPEVITIPLSNGYQKYLDWVASETI